MKRYAFSLILFVISAHLAAQTYAERLGYPADAKVLILHVDDIGMSYDSNLGAIKAMQHGVANSLSMMMPCGWVPGFLSFLKQHPETDAGLHLTLTSEWENYRWGPLAGKPTVPSLVDDQGAMWGSVNGTVQHASADEIEKEIRAQLDRSRTMGWEPTHLDSHMGVLFANQAFFMRYLKVGIEEHIPVLFPGGHNTLINEEGNRGFTPEIAATIGKQLWNAGLPVIDDLYSSTYDWNGTKHMTDEELRNYKTEKYIALIDRAKPGITEIIMHCTEPTEVFKHISSSTNTRKGDLLAMTDPILKKYLSDNHIILTTWRELSERRAKVKE